MSFDFSTLKEEDLEEYKRLYKVREDLDTRLIKSLPKPFIVKTAKKIGLSKGKHLKFENPVSIAVLMDYCLYCCFNKKGKNKPQQFLKKSPPPPNSNEMKLLRAMCYSFYSIFQVKEKHKNFGVLLSDMLYGNEIFMMDIRLTEEADPDMIIAMRLLPFKAYYIASGSAIVIPIDIMTEKFAPIIRKFLEVVEGQRRLSSSQEAKLVTRINRAAIKYKLIDTI